MKLKGDRTIMKQIVGFIVILFTLLLPQSIKADDVEDSIDSYIGRLSLHENNQATFAQQITFSYDSNFRGQYVNLGKAGRMPEGFDIIGEPIIAVKKNGQSVANPERSIKKLKDGYRLKIYNGGVSGDKVEILVIWKLKNILYPYQDVAELNWKPISDTDETIKKVIFTVSSDQQTENAQLWGHRGYFKAKPQISRDGSGTYTLTAENVDGVLELHGFWDSSILGNSVERLPGKALPRIKRTEAAIKQKTQQQLIIFSLLVPSVIVALVLVQLWRFLSVKKELDRYRPNLGKTRLYEVPENLSPLALAQEIYQVDFKSMVDLPKWGKIRFDNAVQAVLVDLLDRGILILDKEPAVATLTIIDLDKASKSDVAFLDMAFGDRLTVPLDQLFADFQYDKKETIKQLRKQFKGAELEEEVRKSSKKVRSQIKNSTLAINKAVKKELASRSLPKIYRDMTKSESRKLHSAGGLGCLFILVAGGLTLYFLLEGHPLCLLYLLMTLLILGVTVLMTRKSQKYSSLGVVTEKGSYRLGQWQSFERMIKDINKFQAVELDGVVVWNRILVYATLLGYADRVEKYMKVNELSLPDQLADLNFHQMRAAMAVSTNHFVSTSVSASSAANFSVSSGDNSGSGGFSGGGGGGSVGSF